MPGSLRVAILVITGVPLGLYCLDLAFCVILLPFQAFSAGRKKMRQMIGLAPVPQAFDRYARIMSGQNFLYRILRLLTVVQIVVGDPIVSYQQLRHQAAGWNDRERAAAAQLRPTDRAFAIFSCVLMAAIAALASGNLVWRPFLLVIPIVTFAGVASRHVSYLMGGLPDRLRRSVFNPFVTVAVIAACDCVAIVLAASILLSPRAGVDLRFSDLRTGVLDLLAFRQVPSLIHDTPGQIIVAGAGLLFYVTVVKALLSPGQSARQGSDSSYVAFAWQVLGNLPAARKWSLQDKSNEPMTLEVRASLSLARNDFGQAMAYGEAVQRAKGEDYSVDSRLLLLFSIGAASLQFRQNGPFNEFIRNGTDAGASDAAVSVCIANAVVFEVVAPTITSSLLNTLPEDSYQLSRSTVLLLEGETERARVMLQELTPASEIEEILRDSRLLKANELDSSLPAAEQSARRQQWMTESLPALRTAVQRLPFHWKKLIAGELSFDARLLRAYDQPEISQQLESLVVDLAPEVIPDEELTRLTDFQFGLVTD